MAKPPNRNKAPAGWGAGVRNRGMGSKSALSSRKNGDQREQLCHQDPAAWGAVRGEENNPGGHVSVRTNGEAKKPEKASLSLPPFPVLSPSFS